MRTNRGGFMEEDVLGIEVKKTSKAIKGYINKVISKFLEEYNETISGTEGMILSYVYRHSERIVSAKMLLDEFGVSKATMSQSLSTLYKKGLITYEEWTGDGRVKRIILTDMATSLENDIEKALLEVDTFLKGAYTEEELAMMHSLLRRLRERINSIENK